MGMWLSESVQLTHAKPWGTGIKALFQTHHLRDEEKEAKKVGTGTVG